MKLIWVSYRQLFIIDEFSNERDNTAELIITSKCTANILLHLTTIRSVIKTSPTTSVVYTAIIALSVTSSVVITAFFVTSSVLQTTANTVVRTKSVKMISPTYSYIIYGRLSRPVCSLSSYWSEQSVTYSLSTSSCHGRKCAPSPTSCSSISPSLTSRFSSSASLSMLSRFSLFWFVFMLI